VTAVYFLIKTTPGRERAVTESLAYKVIAEKTNIFSVTAPDELRGYVIIEARTSHPIDILIRDVKNARSRLPGVLPEEEVTKYLGEKPTIESLSVGDIIEVKSGVFKRMKAKVVEMNTAANEITIELQEGTSPFPITLSADLVRLVGKGKEAK